MKAQAKIPKAFDVLHNAERARQQEAVGGVRAQVAVDPARMKKAAEGLMKRGAREVASYFERNAANPFPNGEWTSDIHLAHIPEVFAFTALGKELKASAGDDERLAQLTAPLERLLLDRGYSAAFAVGAGEESGPTLAVRLKVWLHEG